MKILVTGAAGFIGGHLIRTLVRMGHECLGMDNLFTATDHGWIERFVDDNKNIQFFVGDEGDCTNEWNVYNMFKRFDPDIVFNLAVLCLPHSLVDPMTNYRDNIKITTNIVEETAKRGKRLVHFSSSEVYGSVGSIAIDESQRMNPSTPYAAAKAACDHLVLSMVSTFGLDATIVRPFNTYGPGQNENTYAAVVPKFIKALLTDTKPMITGDGKQTRDMNYVTDVVDAAILAAERGRAGEVYNISSGTEISIVKLLTLIAESMGMDTIDVDCVEPRKGDVMRHMGNGTKIRNEIGWRPIMSMEDGLRETIEWYKNRV